MVFYYRPQNGLRHLQNTWNKYLCTVNINASYYVSLGFLPSLINKVHADSSFKKYSFK